jgi:hypothetical protein
MPCRGRLDRLLATPFASAHLEFDDGSLIRLNRTGQLTLPGVEESESADPPQLGVVLDRPNRDPVDFTVSRIYRGSAVRRLSSVLERHLPVERVGVDEWIDMDWGDRVPLQVIAERYREHLPPEYFGAPDEQPEEFKSFIEEVPVHLIETQRLLVSELARKQRRGREGPSTTVLRYSDDLVGRLRSALAENSTTSQRLDRTFPRRVLTAPAPDVTDEQIRDRYANQARLRDRLTGISLLDTAAADLPLPDRALADWERRVLWTYLEDTEQKLATFQPLLDRAQLLQEIVNGRFLFKTLTIDREGGFRFRTDEGGDLGPGSLSSGEQHELVLAYDLLFNAKPASLVLIDEPEISLHVAWQQQFLNDLIKISTLQSLRFIVATHSPQVIHKWWHRAKALYEEPTEMEPSELEPDE